MLLCYYVKELQEDNHSVKDLILKSGIKDSATEDLDVYKRQPLKRAIQSMIEDKIAEAILDGKIKKGKTAKHIYKAVGSVAAAAALFSAVCITCLLYTSRCV